MEDDMLKAQIKVVDILCDLELIYPPALFDIMIHLVIHLPLEALEGGPIRPRWMFPVERYMKKLKGYVRNKVKPKGSIAEGYVAEEALTFGSHYFRDIRQRHIDNDKDPEVDIPPDIIDVVDEDDDITDDEDSLPHDLADYDNEDLINVDDDDICQQILPDPTAMTVEVRIAPSTPRKRMPNLGGRAAGRLNTRDKNRNLSLKEITDMKGPVPIQFELRDKQTVMPLGDHVAHWSSYIREVIIGFGTGLRIFPDDMSPGNMCHRGTNFLSEKYVGPTVSLRIIVGEEIPCERSPANIPRRQVTGEKSFPGDMLPRNMCHRGTYFLTGKYVGPTVLPRNVAEEGIPYERSSATIPRRPIPSDKSPRKAGICR
nr:hypothetical protein [Tanacetum cinerariifolium]